MKRFTEYDKLSWPLNRDSIVVEVGAHKGAFAEQAHRQWGCRVFALEPIPEFFNEARKRLDGYAIVRVIPIALGGASRRERFSVHGEMTGLFANGDPAYVEVCSVPDFLKHYELPLADLLSINCEGSEYEILECILAEGLATRFRSIQVQPHTCVPDFEARWKKIQDGLSVTHECVWAEPWCWEGWKLK